MEETHATELVVGDVLCVWLMTIESTFPAAYLPLAGYVFNVLIPKVGHVPLSDAEKYIGAMHACEDAGGVCRWQMTTSQFILDQAFEVGQALGLCDRNPARRIAAPWDE